MQAKRSNDRNRASRRAVKGGVAGVAGIAAAIATAGLLYAAGAMAQGSGTATGVQSVTGAPERLPPLSSTAYTQAPATQASAPAMGAAPMSASNGNTSGGVAAAPTGGGTTSPANAGMGGNISELQRRIAGKELAELRTVYNGSFGASLLMATTDATYYVALFERKDFWRVVKTQDDARAEAIFADFSRQTADLASAEIRGVKLSAQRSATEQLIALNKDRAARIQADLAVQQTQQQMVSERQAQAQAQVSELADENRRAQAELADLQRQLADLQRQADDGLPKTPRRR